MALDWANYSPPQPFLPGLTVFGDYDLAELRPYIDWTPFFRTWELVGKFPHIFDDPIVGESARNLWQDAQKMLDQLIAEKWLTAKGVIGLFPAASAGDDIVVYTDASRREEWERIHCLRQQMQKPPGRPNHSLADFVAPVGSGLRDHVGLFVVTTGHGLHEKVAEFEAAHDDYNAILLQALGDRLAEAFAERLHERVRVEFWGYEGAEEQRGRGAEETAVLATTQHSYPNGYSALSTQHLTREDLIAEKYQGIRPAPGYPACPDHTEKETLFAMLEATKHTGVTLTESMAMWPAAAVSGYYFSHPQSQYFGLGRIARDQVVDYAARKGLPLEVVERWLAPNLGYEG